MANYTAVALLLGHFDIKINNLVKISGNFQSFLLLEIGRILNLSLQRSFPVINFLCKLFQGVLQAKNTLLSFCMGEKKAFCLSSLLLKHRKLKISNLDVFLRWKLTNLSYV